MSIAIHSRKVCPASLAFLEQLLSLAEAYQKRVIVSTLFAALLPTSTVALNQLPVFDLEQLSLQPDVELIISVGGDGTFLETIHYLKDHAVPVLGMHTGSLGFLTRVTRKEAVSGLIGFFEGSYSLEERSLLALYQETVPVSFALNEVALLKRERANLLTIEAYIDGQFITTYRADGLIIATPTGSTAYSLSCSGPIVLTSSNSFVITPISPHNLALRPLVVPDTALLSFVVKRQEILISTDGRVVPIAMQQPFVVKKAPYSLKLVQFGHATIFDVLREKFYWGLDARQ
ncbi:MAG: NAD(+)/NADH kinase [Candidatus Cardinium sp.]|uniref:NAD(+)/NADH kinase n=1 Tax=Candidatus Cardinium sp. TP TaxID=2961955 RepID=UPI0021AE9D4B|nr:NAD(+)/NADH kinase [Candidatus Cardinium sp. TP]MCT4697085.1 NAD(+)/NADH kinase [Candidatus Cardinium sp. TP]MDN5246621.1 NAD(+)/NADH kinase [Candidatus Cardinium sp.]